MVARKEPFPNGKLLFKTAMLKRGYSADRAEADWICWEQGFMTKEQWEETAKTFLAAMKLNVQLGRTKPTKGAQ